MMWVPDQQLRAVRGGSVTLSCVVESHPEALTFWHHAGRIVQPRGKFFMSTVQGKPSYKVKLEKSIHCLHFAIMEAMVRSFNNRRPKGPWPASL